MRGRCGARMAARWSGRCGDSGRGACRRPGQAQAGRQRLDRSGEWTADTRNGWRGDDGQPRVQLNLRTADGGDRWGFGVRVTDLQGLPAAARDGSRGRRRASRWPARPARFTFTGSFDAAAAPASFAFAPNAGLHRGHGRARLRDWRASR